ncbi:AbrB/MazE/SpoVT family DNA-binding domain-containing protein [Haladaptatus sp. DYF46]|uniref:AbrB/MazE/SpoVT family DNA-binding domain-containing protein n=1 Tax=Haladaptatus sp. DYF46 TaxID=2886041 RepID=UPI001E5C386B|nr:AbrB/MazE/SpoVT family DNA-binding domain-containing protein [Haladaptatus sp. DYF46]
MTTVDSKGRIVLPQEVRERLGITPGTEVEIHDEDGKAVVEPEKNPEQIIDRMEQLVAETASGQREGTAVDDTMDPIARKHRDAVRRGAEKNGDE